MAEIILSYVLTTYNKLPFLKIVLDDVIRHCKEDEEIVVVDGGSKDGTSDYLQTLFESGKIHQFVSEKDLGEAHGFNKGILLAKGILIKLLSDDDAFDFDVIQSCRQFLLNNNDADIVAANGFGLGAYGRYVPYQFEAEYKQYAVNKIPFAFTGLGLVFRRKAVAIFGLFNTSYIRVDAEFSLRITSSKCNLYWYTGYSWFHIGNDLSNSSKYESQMNDELFKLKRIYLPSEKAISTKRIRDWAAMVKRGLIDLFKKKAKTNNASIEKIDFNSQYLEAVKMLKDANINQNFRFLNRNHG